MSTSQTIVQPSRVVRIMVLIAVIMTGCSRRDPVAEIRSHTFRPDVSLEAAYSRILDNVAWERTRVERIHYVTVSGTIRSDSRTLKVFYNAKLYPPVVTHFHVDGTAHTANEFSAFLSSVVLRQTLSEH